MIQLQNQKAKPNCSSTEQLPPPLLDPERIDHDNRFVLDENRFLQDILGSDDDLPTRSAVGRRGQINTAAFVTSVALMAQILSACSIPLQSVSETHAAARYPDLNDPPPMAEVRADQVAQIKADLIQVRDDQERAAARQQTPQASRALVSVVLQ